MLLLLIVLLYGCELAVGVINTTYAEEFYKAAKLFQNGTSYSFLPRINLLRIPKASSSSLSAIARRIVGCTPAGPCCKWPGDPPGSCPSKELYKCEECGKVIGCTGHRPDYKVLMEGKIISITMIRDPFSRSLSAFFYPGPHHNVMCRKSKDLCFHEYAIDRKWRNIAVKMLTGAYAYDNVIACKNTADCPHSLDVAIANIQKFTLFGVSEMWELSLLLLHRKIPFLEPILQEFLMTASEKTGPGVRKNTNDAYVKFKRTAFVEHTRDFHIQNDLDVRLYEAVIAHMCQQLHHWSLWQLHIVRDYWKRMAPVKISMCTEY
jgi:hypothetical protein